MTDTAPVVGEERLLSIRKQYRYRAYGESRDENDNVAQELADVAAAIDELLALRQALALAGPALESALESLLVEQTRFEERARRQNNAADKGLAKLVAGYCVDIRSLTKLGAP